MILLHIRSFYLLQQFKKTKTEIERSNEHLEDQLREFLQAVEVKNQELVAEVEWYISDAQKSVSRSKAQVSNSKVSVETIATQNKTAPKKKSTSDKPTHVASKYQQNSTVVYNTTDELNQIRMYDQQGKSVAEMATLLGRAESEVNLLLFMARKELDG